MDPKPVQSVFLDSARPDADMALLRAEWAVMRKPTRAERAHVGVAWDRVASAFVIRACNVPVVLLAWKDEKRSLRASLAIRGVADRVVRQVGLTAARSKSVVAFLAAGALAPEKACNFAEAFPASGICEDCDCVWSMSGPFIPGSEQNRLLRALAFGEGVIQGSAAA